MASIDEFQMLVYNFVKRISNFASKIIHDHIETLRSQFDPVEDLENRRQLKQPNYKFALPIVIMFLAALDGALVLPCQSDPEHFDVASLQLNSFVFTHQCMPHSLWLMFDFLIVLTTVATSLIYVSIIFIPNLDSKFVFYKSSVNGKYSIGNERLQSSVSHQIGQFHCHTIGYLKVIIPFCVVSQMLFYYAMVLLNSHFHQTIIHSIIFWLVGHFLFITYLVYGAFIPTAYILIASRFMQIRQKYVLSKLKALSDQICKTKKSNMCHHWMCYKMLNREQIDICKQICEYARFGMARLSVLIPFYIIGICYLLYLNTVASVSLAQMYIFFFLLIEANLFLLAMISECARVDKNNRSFMRLNQQCCIKYFERLQIANVCKLTLKAQTLQTINRLRPYSFYILGIYRITNKSYNMIISYISVFFMYLFQHQLMNHY